MAAPVRGLPTSANRSEMAGVPGDCATAATLSSPVREVVAAALLFEGASDSGSRPQADRPRRTTRDRTAFIQATPLASTRRPQQGRIFHRLQLFPQLAHVAFPVPGLAEPRKGQRKGGILPALGQ